MAGKIRRLGILIALTAVLMLGVVLFAFSYSDVGKIDELMNEVLTVSADDFSAVPQSVAEDAGRLAAEQYGDSHEKYKDFVDQLLATYIKAEDKDFIVVFNSGGWGWNLLDKTPGWSSILAGIRSELDDLGYESIILSYRRTSDTIRGRLKECAEVTTDYPSKAKDLACRVEFLTAHIPDLRVIVTGESNGTVISDYSMNILRDNPQVYSIQTGVPFWHKSVMLDRTLVLNSNGTGPDTFSQGDITTMLWLTLRDWLGLPNQEENPGRIGYYVRAPGHDYSWQYPEVYSQVVEFLETNFEVRQ
ncbi:hypothetical protein ACFLUO_05405 [Chloroflexota bacterium]